MFFLPERIRARLPKSKSKDELSEHYDKTELEKGDFLAMCIAALITFLPVLLITIGVIYGLIWLIFT